MGAAVITEALLPPGDGEHRRMGWGERGEREGGRRREEKNRREREGGEPGGERDAGSGERESVRWCEAEMLCECVTLHVCVCVCVRTRHCQAHCLPSWSSQAGTF